MSGGSWAMMVEPQLAEVKLSVMADEADEPVVVMKLGERETRELREACDNALQRIRAAQS